MGAKYHHRIPQTYLRAWGENVWVYDKKTDRSEQRNIDSIMGQQFFHSIKAGSLFYTQESLSKIFSALDPYSVRIVEDGKEILLNTKEQMNKYWFDFDNWIIEDGSGRAISRKQRNVIKTTISQTVDNTIEDEWSSRFESDWADIIGQIYQGLKDIHQKKKVMLTEEAFDAIVRYYVMFQWRGYAGFEEARKTYDWIMSLVPEIRDLATENPVHREDKTAGDEMWHAFLLSSYYKFLNGQGIMEKQYEEYRNRLTLLAMLDPSESLLASDTPCFEYMSDTGNKEPIFVALPGLLISFVKKDPNNLLSYSIKELSKKEVEDYNTIIIQYGNKIVSRNMLNWEK